MAPPELSQGRFISFEGIDGAGKSTHIEALAEHLRSRGIELLLTREPGGTALAESLRELVLHQGMDPLTEALLVFAARRDHWLTQIEPALKRGTTVLCDRFADASFAYQGGGRGFSKEVLTQLEVWVLQGHQPDLTLWFDLPPQVAAGRRSAARIPDRFESQDQDFFVRVRDAYAQRAAQAPERIVRLNAQLEQSAVWSQILAALASRGWA